MLLLSLLMKLSKFWLLVYEYIIPRNQGISRNISVDLATM